MNTLTYQNPPHLPLSRHRDYEIILEDLEFVFSKKQLNLIKEMHNEGKWISDISIKIKRNEYEVLLAIVHLHKRGRIKRELAFRRKNT